MSAIPQSIPDDLPLEPVHGGSSRPSGLPRRAQIYLVVVGIGTIAAAGRFYVGATSITHGWAVFVVLAAAATVAAAARATKTAHPCVMLAAPT